MVQITVDLRLYRHKYIEYISVDAYTPVTDLLGAECLIKVQARIDSLGIVICHLPERILNDHRGVTHYCAPFPYLQAFKTLDFACFVGFE